MGRNVHRGLEIVEPSHGQLTPDVRSDPFVTGPNAPPSFYTTAGVRSDPFFTSPNGCRVRFDSFLPVRTPFAKAASTAFSSLREDR